jgi:hypothetical protein
MSARSRWWRLAGASALVATLAALTSSAAPRPARAQAAATLRAPDAFASIPDRAQRSIALFTEAGKVFQHPRCQNCHPGDDHPRQGEGRLHQPPVRGGADGDGVPGLRCAACHGEANYDAVGMPGLADWHLAPRSMNLRAPLAAICAQLKDPDKNGSRSLEDVVKHVANDPLVAWAWAPGAGRLPAPGTHATFFALLRAWAATGAECPAAGS